MENIKSSLNCIRKYPKDFTLCHGFINSHNWDDLYQILESIMKKERDNPKLDPYEQHALMELTCYVESIVINTEANWIDLDDMDYPSEDFFMDDVLYDDEYNNEYNDE